MTYQALARKWRPKSFNDMVGQEHVRRALINAMEQGRLHHAYLFSGTRGVGKTTIARIIAKCFNCDKGPTSEPCGQCGACQDIDQGRFVDLIEIDAASRTKVEDTREILENVQYAPTRGRYKIYLIDEVHMLSGHSFNALLKTLEEPPEHVKFLLATTDPQKLPITVLSRCLQFNLKSLPQELISKHLSYILQEEKIQCDPDALSLIARAAKGSMRDGLSLLDQAIAYGGGEVKITEIRAMLGSIEQRHILTLLTALLQQQVKELMTISATLAELALDYNLVLEDLITAFHQISIFQCVADAPVDATTQELQSLAQQFKPEDIQLYYQIALIGKRDLSLAPTERIGFEMTLMRMLNFTPTKKKVEKPTAVGIAKNNKTPSNLNQTNAVEEIPLTGTSEIKNNPITSDTNPPGTNQDWHEISEKLKLTGIGKTLISYCSLVRQTETSIELLLDQKQSPLLNPELQQRIQDALSDYFNKEIQLTINIATDTIITPATDKREKQINQHNKAQDSILNDAKIQSLISAFDGKIQTDSIKPIS